MARQRSTDLFPTDQPIPASQMIGRETDVREITTALAAGSNLVVAGPRRTGKTSVCDAAVGRLVRRGFYAVSIDLFRIASTAEFAEALVAATLSNRSALRRVIQQTRRAGRVVADALQTSAVLKSKAQLGEEIEIVFTPGAAARDPVGYLDYALSLPGRIAEADGKEVVVFFDEFQEVAGPHQPYGDADRLTKRMRAIFQRTTGVSYLFAGSLEHMMRDLFTPSHRALHQFGGFHALRPIDAEAWREGLSERFAADDCQVEPAALERIIEYGEGHPRSTMLIAQKSHLATLELGTREIDLTVVEQGLLGAMAPTGSPTSRSPSESGARTSSVWSSPSVSRAGSRSTPASPGERSGAHSRRCETPASSTARGAPIGASRTRCCGVISRRWHRSDDVRHRRRMMRQIRRIMVNAYA